MHNERRTTITADMVAEIQLRHHCGESGRSIARAMSISRDAVKRRMMLPGRLEAGRVADRAYAKEWYKKNKARGRAADRAWHARHPGYSREHKIKCMYGLSNEAYSAMVKAQGGRCAICRQSPSRWLEIDHDHDTGRVRALLCGPCNRGMGTFRDNPALLRAAAAYLETFRVEKVLAAG